MLKLVNGNPRRIEFRNKEVRRLRVETLGLALSVWSLYGPTDQSELFALYIKKNSYLKKDKIFSAHAVEYAIFRKDTTCSQADSSQVGLIVFWDLHFKIPTQMESQTCNRSFSFRTKRST